MADSTHFVKSTPLTAFSISFQFFAVMLQTRVREDRGFSVLDQFRIHETVLFCEKHIFIGPKSGTFYLFT